MLLEEAEWIGKELEKIIHAGGIKSVLNIGSSSNERIAEKQKHIGDFIINPLIKSNIKIINTDIISEEGVDIVGDLYDEECISKLIKEKPDLIICANLLEHVKNPEMIAANINRVLKPVSYAIITVPHIYPYHPDPEDYLLRPLPVDISNMFKNTLCISSEIVKGRRLFASKHGIRYFKNYAQVLFADKRLLLILMVRFFTPFYKFKTWKNVFGYLPKLFKHFSVSCVVLKKENE